MSKISLGVNVEVELNEILKQADLKELTEYVLKQNLNLIDFYNVDESTYDKLVELFNRKTLNLELLVGKVAVKNLMGKASSIIKTN